MNKTSSIWVHRHCALYPQTAAPYCNLLIKTEMSYMLMLMVNSQFYDAQEVIGAI